MYVCLYLYLHHSPACYFYAPCSVVVPDLPADPCYPSPCGANAICRERNGAGSCSCIQNYFGDPYINCRPECVQNSDCAGTKACINMKCRDPCANACGFNAICRVTHHQPVCSCEPGFSGNPLRACVERPSSNDEIFPSLLVASAIILHMSLPLRYVSATAQRSLQTLALWPL